MGDGLNIRGVVGQIKWSYYSAARLEGYTVRRDKVTRKWSLVGRIVHADAFKLSRRPLVFVAPTNKGTWSWPIQEHEIQEGRIRAQLGDPDEPR